MSACPPHHAQPDTDRVGPPAVRRNGGAGARRCHALETLTERDAQPAGTLRVGDAPALARQFVLPPDASFPRAVSRDPARLEL